MDERHIQRIIVPAVEQPRHWHVAAIESCCNVGVPPSWARKQSSQAGALESTGDDDDVTIETWRRKYLWFPMEIGDDGLGYPIPHWPPYYGSWSKTRFCLQP